VIVPGGYKQINKKDYFDVVSVEFERKGYKNDYFLIENIT
jgi:hypothetical protein